ncbi:MAG: hypothetical protein ACLUD0_06440 [Eubacterium ramulus]
MYSGASYKLTSENGVQATITANDDYSDGDATRRQKFLSKNDTDGRPNGGYGVVSNFKLNKNGLAMTIRNRHGKGGKPNEKAT